MPTTQPDIRSWLRQAKEQGVTHMVVAMDTFDYEDYPIYTNDPRKTVSEMQDRLMEVYSVNRDWEAQLSEFRAFHYD